MQQHTPGPWAFTHYEGEHSMVTTVATDRFGRHQVIAGVERVGDARLMHAAPDLLAACEELLATHSLPPDVAGAMGSLSGGSDSDDDRAAVRAWTARSARAVESGRQAIRKARHGEGVLA